MKDENDDDEMMEIDLQADLGFSPEEIEEIAEVAAENGMTLAEFVVESVVKYVALRRMVRLLGIKHIELNDD
jgi:hypothetical protein